MLSTFSLIITVTEIGRERERERESIFMPSCSTHCSKFSQVKWPHSHLTGTERAFTGKTVNGYPHDNKQVCAAVTFV